MLKFILVIMGQTHSDQKTLNNYNTLIGQLVNSNTKESVQHTLMQYKWQNSQNKILPDFMSDLIAILSLLFMVAVIIYLKVKIGNLTKQFNEAKKENQRSSDKWDKNIVSICKETNKNNLYQINFYKSIY